MVLVWGKDEFMVSKFLKDRKSEKEFTDISINTVSGSWEAHKLVLKSAGVNLDVLKTTKAKGFKIEFLDTFKSWLS